MLKTDANGRSLHRFSQHIAALCAAATLLSAGVAQAEDDAAPAARAVCKDFITRSGYAVQDFGEYWRWSTVRNADGTYSVGARFIGMPPGGVTRNLYVTCIVQRIGKDRWALERLTRLL